MTFLVLSPLKNVFYGLFARSGSLMTEGFVERSIRDARLEEMGQNGFKDSVTSINNKVYYKSVLSLD